MENDQQDFQHEEIENCLKNAKLSIKDKNYEDAYYLFSEGLTKYPDSSKLQGGLQSMQKMVLEKLSSAEIIDAVDLCNQDAYPGDEILILQEKEKVSKMFSSVQDNFENCYKNAVELIEKSNTEFKRNGSMCIEYNEENTRLWEKLLTELYELKCFKECYQCTEYIPAKQRTAKIWIVGGKTRRELGLPILAENWFRIATKLDQTDKEAANLFQQVRVQRTFQSLTKNFEIDVSFNKFGRAITATSDHQNLSVIFQDKPLVIAQTVDTDDIPACSNCAICLISAEKFFGVKYMNNNPSLKKHVKLYWPTRSTLRCTGCKHEIYCSDVCRIAAWENYHQIICPSENRKMLQLYDVCQELRKMAKSGSRTLDGYWNATFSPLILARLWATVLCDARKAAMSDGRETVVKTDLSKAQTKFRKFIAHGQGGMTKMIPKMYELMKSIFSDSDPNKNYDITPREFNARYFQITCNTQAFSDPDHPIKEFKRQLKGTPDYQDVQNCFENDFREAVFAGLFPLQACLNHSCMNNVEVLDGLVDSKPGVIIRAKQDIKKGEELFTSYVDTSLGRQERRGFLYRGYNFWCECPRCQFEGDDSDTCTNCKKEADDDKGFPVCSRCHNAWYCSKICQKTSWKKGHKNICFKGQVSIF